LQPVERQARNVLRSADAVGACFARMARLIRHRMVGVLSATDIVMTFAVLGGLMWPTGWRRYYGSPS